MARIIATRGKDRLEFIEERDGKQYCRILFSDGTESGELNLQSVLARGYWTPVDGMASFKAYLKAARQ